MNMDSCESSNVRTLEKIKKKTSLELLVSGFSPARTWLAAAESERDRLPVSESSRN